MKLADKMYSDKDSKILVFDQYEAKYIDLICYLLFVSND
jgi:hypothetical protein